MSRSLTPWLEYTGTGVAGRCADRLVFGLVFEALVARDLRVLCQQLGGSVLHYRDNKVDAVVELADGRWAAFEIKLGQAAIDRAATSLSKFRDVVDLDRRGEPAVLGVITATGYGYVPCKLHLSVTLRSCVPP